MLGKRCRSVRGGVAMGLECFPVDAIAAAEQSVEKQVSPKCGSPCAHRLIVGFDLKASPDKQHENCLLLEKQSASTKSCRPTSGLESLLSSPRTQGVKNLPMESGGKLSSEDVSSKTECDSMASKIAARFTDHNPSRSDRQQKQSCEFGNPCKQSHPIPIAHSPLREALASCASKALNSNQPSSRDPSHLGRASLKKNTEAGEEVERCVFSLLTASPGTYDGAEYVSFCTMDFLEACFLCKRHLGHGRDIFMYRGDKAFCSVECRQQQIVIDEHAELGKKYLSAVHKRGASVQSRRSNHRTRVLAVSTAAAA